MGTPTSRKASKAQPTVARWQPRVAGAPKLLHIMEWRFPDGTAARPGADGAAPVTRADKIIAYLRTNASFTAAAAAAGVDNHQLTVWRREAADAMVKRATIQSGNGGGVRLTQREKVLIDFAERVEQAIGENHVRAAGALTKLAEGGIQTQVITEKVEHHHTTEGEVIERVIERKITSSQTLPSVPAIDLLLSRRFKEDWGRTDTVNVNTHHQVTVTTEQLGEVLDTLSAKIARRAAQAALAAGPADDDVVDAEVVEPGAAAAAG